jgi:hypothetical protein
VVELDAAVDPAGEPASFDAAGVGKVEFAVDAAAG